MGLNNSAGAATFVNISKGRLYTKEKDKAPNYFTDIDGTITNVSFEERDFRGDKFEIAKFVLADNNDKFILQMRTDSGYFRGLCNSLKTGDPTDRINIAPSYKEIDDKPQSTCFVKQYGKVLKHAYAKDRMGDLPPVDIVTFKGKTQYDGSNQVEFWKKWLLSIKFNHPVLAGAPTPLVNADLDNINNKDLADDLPF